MKMMRRSLAKGRKGHPKIWDSMERLPQKSQFPDTLGDVFHDLEVTLHAVGVTFGLELMNSE